MEIKVFSFNIRTNTPVDGVNAFPNRKERILSTIKEYSPDLIGFQEATDDMREWLRASLNEYEIVGCGRKANYRGEAPVLAYRKNLFECVKYETFWLSLTPDIPGSSYGGDQSGCPRTATAAYLIPEGSSTPFVFCNTHTDHKGKSARYLASVQLIQYLSRQPYKFILTGDFNATPDAPEIRLLTESTAFPMIDATSKLGGTFHGYGKCNPKVKIDYVFTNLPCDPDRSTVVPDIPDENGLYTSDHCAVCSYVEI